VWQGDEQTEEKVSVHSADCCNMQALGAKYGESSRLLLLLWLM
jgi:hypothetical protein